MVEWNAVFTIGFRTYLFTNAFRNFRFTMTHGKVLFTMKIRESHFTFKEEVIKNLRSAVQINLSPASQDSTRFLESNLSKPY